VSIGNLERIKSMNAILQPGIHDRSNFLGGSDVAAILGVSPWKSEFALYQEKIGEYQEEVTPTKQKIFNRGKRWEPIVIEMLVDELEDRGHEVQIITRNARYVDPEHGFLAAEIDLELMIDGEHTNGEMKTVHAFAAKDWGEQETDEIPIWYTAQVAHGQMITGRNQTIVAALIGADDLRVHVVNRDDELIQIIRGKEIEFWNRIQRREPPEPTTASDINRLYQVDAGTVMEADVELIELIAEASNTKRNLKDVEAHLDILITRIKARMGEAALLMHNGQKLCSWKNNKQSTKIDWEGAFESLSGLLNDPDLRNEVLSGFTTTKPGARPFILK
jgi:putative phage-type endonuclease